MTQRIEEARRMLQDVADGAGAPAPLPVDVFDRVRRMDDETLSLFLLGVHAGGRATGVDVVDQQIEHVLAELLG